MYKIRPDETKDTRNKYIFIHMLRFSCSGLQTLLLLHRYHCNSYFFCFGRIEYAIGPRGLRCLCQKFFLVIKKLKVLLKPSSLIRSVTCRVVIEPTLSYCRRLARLLLKQSALSNKFINMRNRVSASSKVW